jgi:CRP/FNR family transcriptional regulator, cyclic AMP receptor protein
MESAGRSTTYRSGETVYRIGDVEGHMYVVLRGRIELRSEGNVVEVVESSGVFGELAMIEAGTPRGDRAVALAETELVAIDAAQFLALAQTKPTFALKLMRTLVSRARVRQNGSPAPQQLTATA